MESIVSRTASTTQALHDRACASAKRLRMRTGELYRSIRTGQAGRQVTGL